MSSGLAGTQRAHGARAGLLAGALALAALWVGLIAVLLLLAGSSGTPGLQPTQNVSALAAREIPATYLRLYEQAGARYGVSWAVLAGIGKVECDHGRDPAPSCTHEGSVNSAGAGGPMQFIASTWAEYGVAATGAGPPDRWNPADAIFAAANFLRAAGAPADYAKAIFAYNHAEWYVQEVEGWAQRYGTELSGNTPPSALAPLAEDPLGDVPNREERAGGADLALQGQTQTLVRYIAGERAELAPGDGHLALIPTGVPPVVQAMLVAGNELQALPYGPAGHPDPLGASEEDCSSTVNYVLYRSGLRPLSEILRENPLAQSYVDWGAPGPGRWVTIYASAASPAHVFMLIAGLRLDTSHDGTDVGPNRAEDGPRWRILDHIPTWAHWSVRHPPGL